MVFAVYALLIAAAGLHLMHYYPLLPDKMAVHFDGHGQPNGWMSKDGFAMFYLVFLSFLSGVFFGVAGLVSKFRLRVNIPNRDYWLAPERIEETVSSLQKGMGFIGTALGLSIIGLHQFVIETNLKPPPVADNASINLFCGAITLIVVGFTAWVFIRFRKPDKTV